MVKWPFQRLSDLHLGYQKVTWKKLVYHYLILFTYIIPSKESTIHVKENSLSQWTLKKKSLNFIFSTKYVIPKSLKFSHWPSQKIGIHINQSHLVRSYASTARFHPSLPWFLRVVRPFELFPSLEKEVLEELTVKRSNSRICFGKTHTFFENVTIHV